MAEGIESIVLCRLSRWEYTNFHESGVIAQILFLKRQAWNLGNSVCSGDTANVWKADFHSLIMFKWSEKDDILLVENDVICSITSIPTNAASFF